MQMLDVGELGNYFFVQVVTLQMVSFASLPFPFQDPTLNGMSKLTPT